MKVAIAGKGGVGKTTLVAQLAREGVRRGYRVLAVDADNDPNLATTLGLPEPVAPLADEEELVKERAGSGGFIRLNPTVEDIPDQYAVHRDGIRLLVLGGLKGGGDGCACAANVLLRALLDHLLVTERDAVLVDMEAGIEHLGRGTVRHVDALMVVVEADRKALETAERTLRLARDLGIDRILAVGNRVRSEEERHLIEAQLPAGIPLLGAVPFLPEVRAAAVRGPLPDGPPAKAIVSLWDALEGALERDEG
jgi:CO dehydrogenase maturation factor